MSRKGIFHGSITIQEVPVTEADLARLSAEDQADVKEHGCSSIAVTFKGQSDCIGLGHALGAAINAFLGQLEANASPNVPVEAIKAGAVVLIVDAMRVALRASITLAEGTHQ